MNYEIFPPKASLPPKGVVKFGIDPTFSRLHLGHLVPLRVVKKLGWDGHPVKIILGTYTAQLGDPSGRDETRPILNEKEVEQNATKIETIVRKVMEMPDIEFVRNGHFLGRLTLPMFMYWVSQFTVEHMLSRDSFKKRSEDEHPIGLHELLVPICQGYDSTYVRAAIEVGGQDQLFNFQIARRMQEIGKQAQQVCVMCPIIVGTDGRKMSKSFGNCIYLDTEPNDMFGQVMSISDEVMKEWAEHLTSMVLDFEDPMQAKLQLAWDIVRQCHGDEAAKNASLHFRKTVQEKQMPEDIPTIITDSLVVAVMKIRTCSRSEAYRLIEQGGVCVNDTRCLEEQPVKHGDIVRVGKRFYGRIECPIKPVPIQMPEIAHKHIVAALSR